MIYILTLITFFSDTSMAKDKITDGYELVQENDAFRTSLIPVLKLPWGDEKKEALQKLGYDCKREGDTETCTHDKKKSSQDVIVVRRNSEGQLLDITRSNPKKGKLNTVHYSFENQSYTRCKTNIHKGKANCYSQSQAVCQANTGNMSEDQKKNMNQTVERAHGLAVAVIRSVIPEKYRDRFKSTKNNFSLKDKQKILEVCRENLALVIPPAAVIPIAAPPVNPGTPNAAQPAESPAGLVPSPGNP